METLGVLYGTRRFTDFCHIEGDADGKGRDGPDDIPSDA